MRVPISSSAIARQNGIELSAEKKLAGRLGRGNLAGHDLRLMIPDTHMNHSGKAVGLAAKYFQIAPEHMLIAHDELDMPPGASRFSLMVVTAVTTVFETSFPPLVGQRPSGD